MTRKWVEHNDWQDGNPTLPDRTWLLVKIRYEDAKGLEQQCTIPAKWRGFSDGTFSWELDTTARIYDFEVTHYMDCLPRKFEGVKPNRV